MIFNESTFATFATFETTQLYVGQSPPTLDSDPVNSQPGDQEERKAYHEARRAAQPQPAAKKQLTKVGTAFMGALFHHPCLLWPKMLCPCSPG
jgi:hypothetical protein